MNRREFIKAGIGLATASAVGRSAPISEWEPAPVAPGSTAAPALAPRFHDGRDWWFQDRFGMFVHWGLYSIHGFHEQEQWRRRVPRSEYVKLVQQWNPVNFNPDAWLDLAAEAGMSYVCFTTKHHDGFCLWDTKLTDYNTVRSPYGRDVLRLLSDACHRRHVPLCLYYSIVDWHHPNYPSQGRSHEIPPQPGDRPDLAEYLDFLRGQVRELCTDYGPIHGFWWDMNVTQHVDPSINAMIRQLQPDAVINNRGFDPGDYGTPERDFDRNGEAALSFPQRTEACQSVGSESWGWRVGEDYYTDRHLLRSIDLYRARDANYLLNVGPKPDGTIDEKPASILRRIGRWHRAVRESFDPAVPASQLTANREVLLTRSGNTLYVHLCHDPLSAAVKLKPLARAPQRATLLNTGAPVEWSLAMVPSDFADRKGFLRLVNLPVDALADTVLVVKLEFDGPPEVGPPAFDDAAYEGFRHLGFQVDGRNCRLVLPAQAAAGDPWIWRTEFYGAFAQVDRALLRRGFHMAYMDVQNMYGAPVALDHMDRFYAELIRLHHLAPKTVLEGLSRGGLFALNWAARNPDKVAAIYVDAPVCDFKSWPGGRGRGAGSPADWDRLKRVYGLTEEQALAYRHNPIDNLAPLAAAKIPILSVCGDADTTVPFEENTGIVEKRYRRLGGEIQVIHKPGVAHHPHGLTDPTPIVDFILHHGSV